MGRENLYLVAKIKDVKKYLNQRDTYELMYLMHKLHVKRIEEGRGSLDCVVVESDWPEYEVVWKMIEDRCKND